MNDEHKGCTWAIILVMALVLGFCAFTQPGQRIGSVVIGSIQNMVFNSKRDPVNTVITNPVYEPVKTSDVLIFPKGTQDWRVIAYTINDSGQHRADALVIEYWCRMSESLTTWTRCYPAQGTEPTS